MEEVNDRVCVATKRNLPPGIIRKIIEQLDSHKLETQLLIMRITTSHITLGKLSHLQCRIWDIISASPSDVYMYVHVCVSTHMRFANRI